ncbi:MAG: CHAT domain-containing tetratricopeptide repeat protein [Ferruginibacter sp.]
MFALLQCFCSYGQTWKEYSDSAKNYRKQNNYLKAIEFYQKGKIMLAKDSLFSDSYLGLCTTLGIIYAQNMKEYHVAESLFLEARNVAEKLHGKSSDYAKLNTFLANVYTSLVNYPLAENLYLEAKDIREKIFTKESAAYAQTCNNLAALYWQRGLFEKAEPLAVEALEIRGRVLKKDDPAYAISCVNLANIYRDMKQYDKAEPLYIEAKNIREKVFNKNSSDYAASCNILADLYYYMGKYDKAEVLYLEAKEIKENLFTKESPVYVESCINLANLFRATGQFDKSKTLFLEAQRILDRDSTTNSNYAINAAGLGALYFDMGDYKNAGAFFMVARRNWEKSLGVKHPYYIENTSDLAKVYWNTNDLKKAGDFFAKSFYAQHDLIENFFLFTSESEKENYLRNISITQDEDFSFYFKMVSLQEAEVPYNISLLNRNLTLSSSELLKKTIYTSTDSTVIKNYNKWKDIKNQLAFFYTKSKDEQPAAIKDLEEEANSIEKQLTRSSSAFKERQKKQSITWKNIQQHLKPNETSIEFAEFQFYNGKRWTDSIYYIAIILRKDKSKPEMISLFEKRQLTTLLTSTGNKASTRNVAALYTRGIKPINEGIRNDSTLYELIWKPLEKSLKGVSRIYFAPAGLLHKIAFAALPVSKDSVLSDKYQLVQLNTTASVVDQSSYHITTSDKIVLYGGIDYNADSTVLKNIVLKNSVVSDYKRSLPDDLTRSDAWQELAGTQIEINEIKKEALSKFAVSVLSGIDATEESVKALNGEASPAVLHIASHGFFFPDPDHDKRDEGLRRIETSGKTFKQSDNPMFRSGLLFAGANHAWQNKPISGVEDGILTSYEVSNLYLPNTKLVVLSACETALGDIQGSEGVYGLQRAFKMAGVQNLVMSLWKVPDAETAEFMQEFYKNMFNKQSISDAFYHAQTTMKNIYRNNPYKWAAWVLVR